jgi:hypothetical protein
MREGGCKVQSMKSWRGICIVVDRFVLLRSDLEFSRPRRFPPLLKSTVLHNLLGVERRARSWVYPKKPASYRHQRANRPREALARRSIHLADCFGFADRDLIVKCFDDE